MMSSGGNPNLPGALQQIPGADGSMSHQPGAGPKPPRSGGVGGMNSR